MVRRFFIDATVYVVTVVSAVLALVRSIRGNLRKRVGVGSSKNLEEASMEEIIIAKTTDDLKKGLDKAMDGGVQRIIIRHRRAKRAHRAVAGIKSLKPAKLALLAAAIAKGDLIGAIHIIAKSGLGPRRIKAIKTTGLKRSYRLGTSYKEVGYNESDTHSERECVLESIK